MVIFASLAVILDVFAYIVLSFILLIFAFLPANADQFDKTYIATYSFPPCQEIERTIYVGKKEVFETVRTKCFDLSSLVDGTEKLKENSSSKIYGVQSPIINSAVCTPTSGCKGGNVGQYRLPPGNDAAKVEVQVYTRATLDERSIKLEKKEKRTVTLKPGARPVPLFVNEEFVLSTTGGHCSVSRLASSNPFSDPEGKNLGEQKLEMKSCSALDGRHLPNTAPVESQAQSSTTEPNVNLADRDEELFDKTYRITYLDTYSCERSTDFYVTRTRVFVRYIYERCPSQPSNISNKNEGLVYPTNSSTTKTATCKSSHEKTVCSDGTTSKGSDELFESSETRKLTATVAAGHIQTRAAIDLSSRMTLGLLVQKSIYYFDIKIGDGRCQLSQASTSTSRHAVFADPKTKPADQNIDSSVVNSTCEILKGRAFN
jgi:hypothetical protein